MGRHLFQILVNAKNEESAEQRIAEELDRMSTERQKDEARGEDGTISANVYISDLKRIRCDDEYWSKRLLLQRNKDGTYSCTDMKTHVVVRFPRLLIGGKGIKVVALYDGTSENEKEISKALATAYFKKKRKLLLFI